MTDILDIEEYLKVLFQSLTLPELKTICKELEIKGYSKYKKVDLVDFVINSMSDEERKIILAQKELEIIAKEINSGIQIIRGFGQEKIDEIRIRPKNGTTIEVLFKGFNWETESYLELSQDTLQNPERDCDCRVGSENGLCPHFWINVIIAIKKEIISINDWSFTKLPDNFHPQIQNLTIPKLD